MWCSVQCTVPPFVLSPVVDVVKPLREKIMKWVSRTLKHSERPENLACETFGNASETCVIVSENFGFPSETCGMASETLGYASETCGMASETFGIGLWKPVVWPLKPLGWPQKETCGMASESCRGPLKPAVWPLKSSHPLLWFAVCDHEFPIEKNQHKPQWQVITL